MVEQTVQQLLLLVALVMELVLHMLTLPLELLDKY